MVPALIGICCVLFAFMYVLTDYLPQLPLKRYTGQLLRRTLLKKPATANIITTNTAPTGANTGPRRASLYHANASGFKTFSFVKETDVLKNVRFMCCIIERAG